MLVSWWSPGGLSPGLLVVVVLFHCLGIYASTRAFLLNFVASLDLPRRHKAAPYDAALLRMAIQCQGLEGTAFNLPFFKMQDRHSGTARFGFYWWHVSNADASLAERSLSHAVQSFHVAHWCHSAWRGANLGGRFNT